MDRFDRGRGLALTFAAAALLVLPLVGAAAWSGVLLASRRRRPPALLMPGLVSVIVLGAAAAATTTSPQATLITVAAASLVLVASWWSAVAEDRDAASIAIGFAVGAGVHVAVALVDLATKGTWPAWGVTAHPNVLGALMAMTLPSLVALRFPPRFRRLTWLAPATGLAGLTMTGSRSALAAVVIAVAVVAVAVARSALPGDVLRRARRGWDGRPIGVTLLVLLVLVGAWVGVRRPTWEQGFGLTGRPNLWGAAAEMVLDRPVLGHGPDAWARHLETVEPSLSPERFPHAHSGYLQVALGFGLVGLAYVVAYFVAMFRTLAVRRGTPLGRWRVAALATLVAFGAVNVADTFVINARFLALIALVWGAAMASDDGAADASPQPAGSPTHR